jgi:glycosyltransferase involved in cell wall biosynthesis
MTGRQLPVVWNIRATNPQARFIRRRTRYLARACARMSGWLPRTIICCSVEARRVHASLGYEDSKIHVIPNGFDVASFRPDPRARAAVRAELGIPQSGWIIGMVARFDPHKDHQTFFEAARRLKASHPDVHFVLCGPDISASNARLREWVEAAGLGLRCHLLGRRQDVPRITAALDIATLSSAEEGFPNVLGEAMACGVPCVATNVGDSARIIGDTGRLVPPRDSEALADAWRELLEMGRPFLQALGAHARRRTEEHFSIDRIARAYEDVYTTVARPAAR